MTPTMTSTFMVHLPDGSGLAEADIPADDHAAREVLGEFASAGGTLTLRCGDGPELVLSDTLRVLVPALCLGGLADLLRSGGVTVNFFDHDETLAVRTTDDLVVLSGEPGRTRAFPRDGYVAAQAACGARFVALARRLWQDNPDQAEPLAALEVGLAQADRI